MENLVRESSIPTTERLYCPNPRCSQLMSRAEALATSKSLASTSKAELTMCRCVKCRKMFCINCKASWHSNMSCDAYKQKKESELKSNDAKLKLLAKQKKWRQCPSCYIMVERIDGCNHIDCRCGHEFCYKCGRELTDENCDYCDSSESSELLESSEEEEDEDEEDRRRRRRGRR